MSGCSFHLRVLVPRLESRTTRGPHWRREHGRLPPSPFPTVPAGCLNASSEEKAPAEQLGLKSPRCVVDITCRPSGAPTENCPRACLETVPRSRPQVPHHAALLTGRRRRRRRVWRAPHLVPLLLGVDQQTPCFFALAHSGSPAAPGCLLCRFDECSKTTQT